MSVTTNACCTETYDLKMKWTGTMNPKISIIIATYNSSQYICECLDSIFNQTFQNIEVVIVDDGSTDNTGEIICTQYSSRECIKYLYQTNAGAGPARNRGIDISTGEYMFFMDPDDKYPNEDSLERLYNAAVENKAKVCGGEIIDCYDGVEKMRYRAGMGDELGTVNAFIPAENYYYLYGHQRYLFDATMIKEHHIRYLSVRRYEDQVFTMQAIANAGELYELHYPVYWHRIQFHVDFSDEIWLDIFKGYRDTIKVLVSCNLKLMFKRNVTDLATSLVGKYRLKGYLNKKKYIEVAEEIDRYMRKEGWSDKTLHDYFEYAEELDQYIKSIPSDQPIILYGAGKNASKFLLLYGELLKKQIIGFAVTEMGAQKTALHEGYQIKQINEYIELKDVALVLITPKMDSRLSIERNMESMGFKNYKWVDMRLLA